MHTTPPPKNPAQLRAWIKYQLELRGTNFQKLAEDNDLTRNAIRHALDRHYPKAERIIAKAIGVEPAALWPDRYDEHGLPKRGQLQQAAASRRSLSRGARRAQGARG